MNCALVKALAFGVIAAGRATMAVAQQPVDIGKEQYAVSCAVCHGEKGKGDGPLTAYFKKPAADLTKIQKNNMGVFPFDRIYGVIDGRKAVQAHGPRYMPVWGREFNTGFAVYLFGFATPKDLESYTRGRIVALIGYIRSLQEK
jgi:mono/diheme cytochrome c family protein